jgi:hypothetical protein
MKATEGAADTGGAGGTPPSDGCDCVVSAWDCSVPARDDGMSLKEGSLEFMDLVLPTPIMSSSPPPAGDIVESGGIAAGRGSSS